MVAISSSLPIGFISVSKLLIFAFALGYFGFRLFRFKPDYALLQLWTVKAIIACMLVFFASLVWSPVSTGVAASTLVKHGKLLLILILIGLIKSEKEARTALVVFAVGQTFLLASSWSLVVGVHPLWAFELDANGDPRGPYVVFSSYLDQSILFATVAGIFYHLRNEKLWSSLEGHLLAIAAIVSVLFLLPGRTGYVIALASISLSVMWVLPKRLRFPALLLVPLIAVIGLMIGSPKIRDRVVKVFDEGRTFTQQTQTESSSGWRLNAWHRSIQAIAEKPLTGHGAGSWLPTVKRLEGARASAVFGDGDSSNPHQEFLLWGVEFGVGGSALLMALLVCVVWDSRNFKTQVARSTTTLAVTIGVACLFNSALYDGLVGDFLCISLGLLLALGVRSQPDSQRSTVVNREASLVA